MPRQISDEEDAVYRQQANIVKFIESIYNDPQLNREAKALIKKKYPTLQIPDYDIMSEVDRRFAEERQQRDAAENEKRQKAEQERFENQRGQTKQKYGFTDEAMTDLEKFMVEHNVGDYEVAATYHAVKNPKPSEATFDDQRWNHSKQEGFAEIAKDPEAWGKAEIMKALHNDQERAKQQRF